MGHVLSYITRRVGLLIPQLLVVTLLSFSLVHLLPGDPATLILGIAATVPGAREAMRARLGLDQPLPVQYGKYLQHLLQGDWGSSFFTQQPVLKDLATRLPSTLELITVSLAIAVVLGLVVGMLTARRPAGILNRFLSWYGFLAGAIPDFWMGLLLIFIGYSVLHLLPAPIGQLSLSVTAPPERTYLLPLDSVLAGDSTALKSSLEHLILPVLTLVLVYTAPLLKITSVSVTNIQHSPFIVAARAHGMKQRIINWYILRNALPPIITTIGVIYAFLLGGAVLVETVFSWNGFGQFIVQSILRKDFFPVQGFVLVAAAFTMFVYAVVDILYAVVDPRVRL